MLKDLCLKNVSSNKFFLSSINLEASLKLIHCDTVQLSDYNFIAAVHNVAEKYEHHKFPRSFSPKPVAHKNA